MKTLETDCVYNIQELINGRWVLRYPEWMTREQAFLNYNRLTTSDYWSKLFDNCRVVEKYSVVNEVERYKP